MSVSEEVERLEPLSMEVANREEELAQLEDTANKLKVKNKDLNDRNYSLTNLINSLELKESQLTSRVTDLEERSYAAD